MGVGGAAPPYLSGILPQMSWGEALRYFGLTGMKLGQNQQAPVLTPLDKSPVKDNYCQGRLLNLH